jgi:hypothetical protein
MTLARARFMVSVKLRVMVNIMPGIRSGLG